MEEEEEDLVAQIRQHLDAPDAPLEDVLNGALALTALGYTVLAQDYAGRVAKAALASGREDLLTTARAILWSGHPRPAHA